MRTSRKFVHYCYELIRRGMLQWGRDEDIAEIDGDDRRDPLRCGFNGAAMRTSRKYPLVSWSDDIAGLLQWGRDEDIAEITPATPMAMRCRLLQWGRDEDIAEMALPVPVGVAA